MYSQLFSLLTVAALTAGVLESAVPGAAFLHEVFAYSIKGFDFTFTQQFELKHFERGIGKFPAYNSKSGKQMPSLPEKAIEKSPVLLPCSDPKAACAITQGPTAEPTVIPIQPTLPSPTVIIEPTVTYIPLPEPTIWTPPCDRKWPVNIEVETTQEKLTIIEIPPCIHLDEY